MASPAWQTADDLLWFRDPGKSAELVRGVLVVREPPSTRHGGRAARLARHLGHFAADHRLGEVFAQDTGFKIQHAPDTARAPDVAFGSGEHLERIPAEGTRKWRPTSLPRSSRQGREQDHRGPETWARAHRSASTQ